MSFSIKECRSDESHPRKCFQGSRGEIFPRASSTNTAMRRTDPNQSLNTLFGFVLDRLPAQIIIRYFFTVIRSSSLWWIRGSLSLLEKHRWTWGRSRVNHYLQLKRSGYQWGIPSNRRLDTWNRNGIVTRTSVIQALDCVPSPERVTRRSFRHADREPIQSVDSKRVHNRAFVRLPSGDLSGYCLFWKRISLYLWGLSSNLSGGNGWGLFEGRHRSGTVVGIHARHRSQVTSFASRRICARIFVRFRAEFVPSANCQKSSVRWSFELNGSNLRELKNEGRIAHQVEYMRDTEASHWKDSS